MTRKLFCDKWEFSLCPIDTEYDSASGWITFANADPTIAAHRADARFTIGIIALSAQQPKAAFLGAISGNVNFAANYTALTNPIYGLYMRSSSSGIVGSVQSNSILTENAAAGSVYVSEDGAIKAYSSSTYPICEGAYLIVCGW